MHQMLADAGFGNIKIQVKENAADIIKDWMPGSGAEKVITSAYVTAVKPTGKQGIRDNVRANCNLADAAALAGMQPADAGKPAALAAPDAGC
mmetsp:Transcript_92021/g.244471  ORF Transcript_92021/g.244471 Transcript_92021/m.244471 type:complete len:92 (+) Transcript_92021:615-890(+)